MCFLKLFFYFEKLFNFYLYREEKSDQLIFESFDGMNLKFNLIEESVVKFGRDSWTHGEKIGTPWMFSHGMSHTRMNF
jgi:hypothetical protein